MKAVKNNKEYTISEQEQSFYEAQGFDIIGDDGAIISYGKGKTVPYEKYAAVLLELEELKANSNLDSEDSELSSMSVDELKAYAESNGIDIGQATTQSGIMAKIKAIKAE